MIFRKGQIEAVSADFVGEKDDGRYVIPSLAYERPIVEGVLNFSGVLDNKILMSVS